MQENNVLDLPPVAGLTEQQQTTDGLPYASSVGRGLTSPIDNSEQLAEELAAFEMATSKHSKYSVGQYRELVNNQALKMGIAQQAYYTEALGYCGLYTPMPIGEFLEPIVRYAEEAQAHANLTLDDVWFGNSMVSKAAALAANTLNGLRYRTSEDGEKGEALIKHYVRVGVALLTLTRNPDTITAAFLAGVMHGGAYLGTELHDQNFWDAQGFTEESMALARNVDPMVHMLVDNEPPRCYVFTEDYTVEHFKSQFNNIEQRLLQLAFCIDAAIICPWQHVGNPVAIYDTMQANIQALMLEGAEDDNQVIDTQVATNCGGILVRLNGMDEVIERQNNERLLENAKRLMAGMAKGNAGGAKAALSMGGSSPTPYIPTVGEQRRHPKSGVHYTKDERAKIEKTRKAAKASRKARARSRSK